MKEELGKIALKGQKDFESAENTFFFATVGDSLRIFNEKHLIIKSKRSRRSSHFILGALNYRR